MDFNSLLTILDDSELTREVVDLKRYDGQTISFTNYTDDSLTATVNGTSYEDLLKVCLVEKEDKVKVYINNVARFKLDNIDLENVSTFSIS